MNRANGISRRLQGGEAVIGVMVSAIRSPEVAPILAAAGYDFLVIDMEHSVINAESAGAILLAAGSTGITALVRPPSKTSDEIPRMLDAGAKGLLVPHIESLDDVRQLVGRTKYAPMGARGVALTRAHSAFRKPLDPNTYAQRANQETMLAIQVESITAIDQLPQIAQAEGIDVVFMGPADLAQSLGLLGQTDHPRVWDALRNVVHTCETFGIAAGTMVHDLESARVALRLGVKFLIYSNDISLLASGGRRALEQLGQVDSLPTS